MVSKVLYYAKVDLSFRDEQDECQILTSNDVPRTSTNITEAVIVLGRQAGVFQLFTLFYSHVPENIMSFNVFRHSASFSHKYPRLCMHPPIY